MRGEKLALCLCMISCTGGVSAVRISDRPKVEPVCSTLLGHFPSKLNISWGVYKPISDCCRLSALQGVAQIPAVKNHNGLKALVLGAVIVELGSETPVDRPKPAASWRSWAPQKKWMSASFNPGSGTYSCLLYTSPSPRDS